MTSMSIEHTETLRATLALTLHQVALSRAEVAMQCLLPVLFAGVIGRLTRAIKTRPPLESSDGGTESVRRSGH